MALQFYKLKVKNIRRETADAVSVAFDIPSELKNLFTYKAGQYLTLRAYFNGEDVRRCYSICTSQLTDEDIYVTIKKVNKGKMSGLVNDRLSIGDSIDVMPPVGNFCPKIDSAKAIKYVLIGGGSGITPLMSIAKTVLNAEPNSSVLLLYANLTENSVIFDEALNELKNSHQDRFERVDILASPLRDTNALIGLLNAKRAVSLIEEKLNKNYENSEFFVCGPQGLMDEIRLAFAELAIPNNQIHFESFTSSVESKTNVATDKSEDSEVEDFTVMIYGEERKVKALPGKTLLVSAIKAGIDPPFSCQIGACSTCRAKVKSGLVEMEDDSALSQDEIDEGWVLTCTSHPKSADVVIDYDDY